MMDMAVSKLQSLAKIIHVEMGPKLMKMILFKTAKVSLFCLPSLLV